MPSETLVIIAVAIAEQTWHCKIKAVRINPQHSRHMMLN